MSVPERHPNDGSAPQDGTERVGDEVVRVHGDIVRETAAKLYAQGYERRHIARIMLDHLVPNGKDRPEEQRLSQARTKLRNWEKSDKFRDLIWKQGLIKIDLQSPAILNGVLKKAKRGRVDAARLLLEVTGRHNPKGDVQPTQVSLVIQGVPRPVISPGIDTTVDTIEGEALVEEDDDV